MTYTKPTIRIGLPFSTRGRLMDAVNATTGASLVSAGSLWDKRRERFKSKPGDASYLTNSALDSAGFVAMMQGGYRWDVSDYVKFVVTQGGGAMCDWPFFLWSWWSAMDYCCEQEIAADRQEVAKRMSLTIESYRDTLEELDWWRGEGDNLTPDPMPVLQGRTAGDYVECFYGLEMAAQTTGREGLPEVIGLGSVCRRKLHGPEGLLTILRELDKHLPEGVRLHLFGVKGDVLDELNGLADRIESIDSMAWDFRARKHAQEQRKIHGTYSNTTERRAEHLKAWAETQMKKVETF